MKRVATWIILTVAAAALLLAMLPAMPAQAEPYGTVKYQVQFAADSDIVSVRMDFNADTNVDSFNLFKETPEQGWPVPGLPNNYFQNMVAVDAGGAAIAVIDEGDHWKVMGGGAGVLSYSVNLSTLRDLTPIQYGVNDPRISPFYPHYQDGYIYLPGYSLFLMPNLGTDEEGVITDPYYFVISFKLPEDWQVFPSWEMNPIPAQFAIDGGVFAGKASVVDVAGDIQLKVFQPQDADPANLAGQQEFADKLAIQLRTANEAWGNPDIASKRLFIYLGGIDQQTIDNYHLLSIPFAPLMGCVFVPVGASENILSTDFLLRAGDESLRELFWHLQAEASALWFREGCIHYSNLRFAQRNQLISEDYVFDQLGRGYTLYADSLPRSGTSLAGAGDQALQVPMADLLYGGGTIAAASIDARLAEKGKTLDEFISILMDKPASDPITNQYLQDELKAFSGEDFSAFFNDYITGDKVIPASHFSQLKLNTKPATDANTTSNTGSNAGQNDLKPAPGFGSKWIMIIIAILLVFALPFLLESYTLRPRGGAEAFDHDTEGKKKGRWWSWDEEDEEKEEKELEDDTGGGEGDKAPGPEEGPGDSEPESVEETGDSEPA